ncbi:hypothetical protein LPJ61_002156 [Coemansia biformis]|uniref:SAM domain-containing protein n=1 Tax=Coemansia biformis TaxID=1286918 RepID=A0A9W7YFC5_9FUNG|nr:hypothetical protein LPJ61_002156 [Coemansia biformis]
MASPPPASSLLPLPLPPPPALKLELEHTAAAPAPATQLPLPDNPPQWSVDDVCRWALGLPHVAAVAPALREHAVDGHVLVNYVTNTVLADELGIAAFGTRVHVLEAIEALRWSLGMCARPHQPPPPPHQLPPHTHALPPLPGSSPEPSLSSQRSPSSSPETPDSGRSSKECSPDPDGGDDADDADADDADMLHHHHHHYHSKRSASRVADAEKKRQKRAELKKNPALYSEYLQKERERNARRRARLRAERGRSISSGAANDARPQDHAPGRSSANDYTHATAAAAPPAYAPFAAADLPAKPAVHIGHPLQPPPHNLRRGPDTAPARRPDPPPPSPPHAPRARGHPAAHVA